MLAMFASSEGPHIAIAPEELFNIGDFTVTNSMVYGFITSVAIILLLIAGAKRVGVSRTVGLSRLLDAGVEFLYNMVRSSLGSSELARKYTPYFATIFFFVVLNNWMGLLPIVGKGIVYGETPLLRPFTGDFNGTLAIALVSMVLIQVISIKESGAVNHVRHYFAGKLYNPITYLVGVFEIFTEFTRLFSLGLRLFLNVVIGEILIAIFGYLGGTFGFATAVPFTLLEVFVGLLQAYIFVLLSVSYLSVSIAHSHKEEQQA